MQSLRDKLQQQMSESEEAQRHNEMIRERYRKLQNAMADQFAEETRTEEARTEEKTYAKVVTPETPTLYVAPSNVETPVFEQNPRVTEYRSTLSVFTTEKFENLQKEEVIAPVVAPAPVQTVAVASQASYSLSMLAKITMAAFVFVVVAMLTLIGINTQLINQKRMRIQNLEEKQEQLMEQYNDLQARIQAATSEETILSYAQSQGW